MKKRELSDDIIEATESTPSEAVELLGRFEAGEYWERPFRVRHNNAQDTTAMMRFVNRLKEAGLEIGKGDAQFGYKMPIPDKNTNIRYLQIFRRK